MPSNYARVAGATVMLALVASCSSTSAMPLDGGVDASVIDAGNDPVCEAMTAQYGRCGLNGSCDAEDLKSCASNAPLYSVAFRDALIGCSTTSCSATMFSSGDVCLRTRMMGSTPSATQQRLASDFCAKCGGDAGSCASDFFRVSADGKSDGAGASALQFVDDIATRFDQRCTPNLSPGAQPTCAAAFATCTTQTLGAGGLRGKCLQPPPDAG
jgi:hypothetical protein